MRLKPLRMISALMFLVAAWGNAYADESSTKCPIKSRVGVPSIYLIDKDSNLVKGPVGFGTLVTKEDFASDYMVKDTQYRAILFPARLEIMGEECNICISVKKISPICPNSSTFSVGVGMVFKGLPGAISPFKVDDAFQFRFIDKKTEVDPEVKLEFEARIVGVLVKSQ